MAPERSRGEELRGDLQAEVMASVWRLGEATVEEVRALQPKARRSAYTTIQTVLNRLVERGLVSRSRRGRKFVYRARADQIDYLTRAIAISLSAFALRLTRGTMALRRELERRALGRGPGDSVVIADPSVLVAVPGFGRGRVVVSDRALTELDSAELDACLAHEAGHLRRRHRLVGLVGGCLAVLARPIPGTRAARDGLLLSLERDADEYAVARTGDPLALASAICKVVRSAEPARRGLIAFGVRGAGETRARLDCLLGGGRRRGSVVLEAAVLALALLLQVITVAALTGFGQWLASAAPPAALASAVTCGH